uniref:Uncharacterized protein n=1 Tax=Timema bartmani TaxID=61472 RepID=A0A7R9HZQ1_9NEOP|nr:unnamed protein product [Timema bartmani]
MTYVPKLWYYDLLSFTVDQEIPKQSASSIPDEDCESTKSGQGENDNSNAELPDKEGPMNTQVTPSQKVDLGRKRVAKKSGASKEAAKELILAKAEKALDRDKFDYYFESVAAKMRRMNEEQRLFAEKMINESVFLGMFNRLTEFSHDIITGPAMDHLIQDGSHTVHMNNGDQELPSNGVGDVARPMLEPRKAEKRLLTDSSEGLPARKKRKKSASAQSQPKNAVCALNELRPGLEYTTVDQSGPVHAPTFTVSVEVIIYHARPI